MIFSNGKGFRLGSILCNRSASSMVESWKLHARLRPKTKLLSTFRPRFRSYQTILYHGFVYKHEIQNYIPQEFIQCYSTRQRFPNLEIDDNQKEVDLVEASIVNETLHDMLPSLEKQSESNELTPEEVQLKDALIKVRDFHKNNTNSDQSIPFLIELTENLRNCYETLTYWDYALQTEQQLEALYLKNQSTMEAHNDTMNAIVIDSWYKQGKHYHRLGQFASAQKLYQKALDHIVSMAKRRNSGLTSINNSDGDKSGANSNVTAANILISMAGIQYEYENFEEMLRLLKQSETIFTNSTDTAQHIDYVKCLQNLGLLWRTVQDYDSALTQYNKAKTVLDTIYNGKQMDGAQSTLSSSLYHIKRQGLLLDIADMHTALDQWIEAIRMYQLVWDEDKKYRCSEKASQSNIDDNDHVDKDTPTALDGIVLHNLGKIHAHQGNIDQAIDELERSIEIRRTIGGEYNTEVGKTLTLLGAVYATKWNTVVGINNNTTATTNTSNQEKEEEHSATTNTARENIEYKLKALECFHQSLIIAKANTTEASPEDDPDVMLALRNIAVLQGDRVPKWGDEESGRRSTSINYFSDYDEDVNDDADINDDSCTVIDIDDTSSVHDSTKRI